MDLNSVRRVSSAGYRLPERSPGPGPAPARPHADTARHARGDAAPAERSPDKTDPVKQDRVWKELVWGERRGVRAW